jgi:hypothetical protein
MQSDEYSADYLHQGFLAINVADYFLLENTIPKIINIMPTPADGGFTDVPKILGSKKSTPASIQSVGAYLCSIGLLFSGGFSIIHPNSIN